MRQHIDIEEYVVLDDLDLNNEVIKNHQIIIDSNIGLSEENVLDAIKHLNRRGVA